jgi:poly [ADP-ribose] polymerase
LRDCDKKIVPSGGKFVSVLTAGNIESKQNKVTNQFWKKEKLKNLSTRTKYQPLSRKFIDVDICRFTKMPPKRKVASKAKNGVAAKSPVKVEEIKVEPKPELKSMGRKKASKVDPLCPQARNCEIYKDDTGDAWECMLNQTNIQNNNNKYFLLQLLVNRDSDVYYTWFRWGRVGYNGQNNLTYHGLNLEAAKKMLSKKFADKTRNEWDEKDDFEKVAGKYELVNIQVAIDDDDKDDEEDTVDEGPDKKKIKAEVKILESQLDAKVQQLIDMICDVKAMEQTLKGLDFDTEKAPLGKVTEDQIRAGYKALSAIADIVNGKASSGRRGGNKSVSNSRAELLQACNDFYTKIPHYSGMRVPPMISTVQDIKAKIELLEALGDIQLGMKIINDDQGRKDVNRSGEIINPIDAHYERLEVKLEPLDHSTDEFSMLEQYIQSTHASTHCHYKMEVEDIFVCEKDSLAFKDKGNRMLLFHGSRLSNYAGILSQGLRIAPPEAPVTGYMFGKGCYFADMSSKSANYCFATPSKPQGLMLLCEVALGEPNELLNADYAANKLPKGKHSVKGVGRVVCDESNFTKLEDGTIVPLGPSKNVNIPGSTLNYNEYIVYDTEQVRLRYMAKLKFNFKK